MLAIFKQNTNNKGCTQSNIKPNLNKTDLVCTSGRIGEKGGIKLLQAESQCKFVTLRSAENLVRKHRSKERTRARFYKDPFKFVKSIFTSESGKLSVSKIDLEKQLKRSCADSRHHEKIILPADMPPIHPPVHQLDTSPPRWSEVQKIVCKARASLVPGPNGVP